MASRQTNGLTLGDDSVWGTGFRGGEVEVDAVEVNLRGEHFGG